MKIFYQLLLILLYNKRHQLQTNVPDLNELSPEMMRSLQEEEMANEENRIKSIEVLEQRFILHFGLEDKPWKLLRDTINATKKSKDYWNLICCIFWNKMAMLKIKDTQCNHKIIIVKPHMTLGVAFSSLPNRPIIRVDFLKCNCKMRKKADRDITVPKTFGVTMYSHSQYYILFSPEKNKALKIYNFYNNIVLPKFYL